MAKNPNCIDKTSPDLPFLSEKKMSNPAKRALQFAGIDSIEKLAKFSEKELLSLHGFGKASLPVIHEILLEHNLNLKEN